MVWIWHILPPQITHNYSKRAPNKISVVIMARHLASSPFLFPRNTHKMNVITCFNYRQSSIIIPGPSPYLSFGLHLSSILYQVSNDLCLASSGSHVQCRFSSLAHSSKTKISLKIHCRKKKPPTCFRNTKIPVTQFRIISARIFCSSCLWAKWEIKSIFDLLALCCKAIYFRVSFPTQQCLCHYSCWKETVQFLYLLAFY